MSVGVEAEDDKKRYAVKRESVCVCECVSERGKEWERVCVQVRERERETEAETESVHDGIEGTVER